MSTPTHVIAINPDTKMSAEDIVHVVNVYRAVKQKRAFVKRIAFRARWRKEETNG